MERSPCFSFFESSVINSCVLGGGVIDPIWCIPHGTLEKLYQVSVQ